MNRSQGWMTVMVFAVAASQLRAEGNVELKDTKDKASYAIGLRISGDFKRQGLDVNADALVAGLKDGLSKAKPQLTDEQANEALTTWQTEQKGKVAARRSEQAEKNKQEGEKFLAENKSKEGVKTLPSGIQYKVLKEGDGSTPKATDTVKTNYRGSLINGTVFDSSKEGQPASFGVGQVIKGWTEVLQMMKVGSKWQVFIPSDLAYGMRGAGGSWFQPVLSMKSRTNCLSNDGCGPPGA